MKLTKAQDKLLRLVDFRDHQEKKWQSLYRLSGRGMSATVARLAALGLITYEEHFNVFAIQARFEVYLTQAGRDYLEAK